MPVFLDLALMMLTGAVDTFMLSRCGDAQVAAVGMANQLMWLVFLVFQFFSMGAAILCAQYFGAKDTGRFRRTVGTAIVLNALFGLAASIAIWTCAGKMLSFMGLREDLMGHGLTYLKITGAFAAFPALSFVFSAALRAQGRVVPPMAANMAANLLNILGNWLLIFGHCGFPELGVAGAAYATAFARFAQFVLLASAGGKLIRAVSLHWRELKLLFAVGIPAMSEEISYSLSQVATIYFINAISSEALATRTYCMNAIMFVFLFCIAMTQGGDILIGHLIGAKHPRPAYIVGNFLLRRSMLVTIACSALLALAGPLLFPLLTTSPYIIETGCIILWIDLILEVGRVRNIFACGTLRATGDMVYPVVVGITVQWSVGVGLAWLLGIPLGLGLIGVWIGFLLDENIRGIILMRRWHSQRWRNKSFT